MLRRTLTTGLATLWMSTRFGLTRFGLTLCGSSLCGLSLLAVSAGIMGSSVAQADEAAAPKFGKAYPSDAIRFVAATSEDREATTMIFDNFVLATETGRGQLIEAKTRTFTFGNAIEAKSDAAVNLDVRGFVSTVAGGSAALVIMAGGETTAVDLQKAIEADKAVDENNPVRKSASEKATTAGFTVSAQPKGSDSFFARVPVKVAEGQPLQATVVLIVDRQPTADSQSLITVDSIDLGIKAVAKSDKTEKKSAKADKAEKPEKAGDKEVKTAKETKEAKAEKKAEAREVSAKKDAAAKKETAEKETEKPATAKAEKEDKPEKADKPAKADASKESADSKG